MGPKEKTLNWVYDRIRKHAALREYFTHLIETEGGVKASLKSVEIDPYQALAIAVVQKAAEDYRGARRALDLSEQYGITPPPKKKKHCSRSSGFLTPYMATRSALEKRTLSGND